MPIYTANDLTDDQRTLLDELLQQSSGLTPAQLERLPEASSDRYAFLELWSQQADARHASASAAAAQAAITSHRRVRGGNIEYMHEQPDRVAQQQRDAAAMREMDAADKARDRADSPIGRLVQGARSINDTRRRQLEADYKRIVATAARADGDGFDPGDDAGRLAECLHELNIGENEVLADAEAVRLIDELQALIGQLHDDLKNRTSAGELRRNRQDLERKRDELVKKLDAEIAQTNRELDAVSALASQVATHNAEVIETRTITPRIFAVEDAPADPVAQS